jgi:hypothetical protein
VPCSSHDHLLYRSILSPDSINRAGRSDDEAPSEDSRKRLSGRKIGRQEDEVTTEEANEEIASSIIFSGRFS